MLAGAGGGWLGVSQDQSPHGLHSIYTQEGARVLAVCSGVTVRWKVKAAPSARWGAEQHQPLPTLLLLADQALALVSSR